MKVVQFCNSFSASSETFIYDTVKELERQGHDCHVLTMDRINEEERPHDKVHLVQMPGRWNLPRLWHRALATLGISGDVNTHKWPVFRHRVRRCLEDLEPDVVHAQFGPPGVLIAPVAKKLDIPLFVTFHGYDVFLLPKRGDWKNRYNNLFESADKLITVSERTLKELVDLSSQEEKTCVVHNGTTIGECDYSDPSKEYDGGVVKLLFVGRLIEVKSPLRLVDVFRRATQMNENKSTLKLTIVGDGPMKRELKDRVKQYGLSDRIDYLGKVSHNEVRRLMADHHIYVQYCQRSANGAEESFGVTFIEAQASGLPVVSTKSGGVPDAVNDGESGYLVPEEDTEAMAERIVQLAQSPDQWSKMGRAGREYVEKHFDLSKQVHKLTDLYKKHV